jgi:ABC-2 type transport system ATP-binding protein
MNTAMIEFSEVRKEFHGVSVLKGFNLTVHAGELVGLIGPNGAGKSTALRILTGQLLADAGDVRIHGHDLATQPLQARQCLGYVPQEPDIEPFLTGSEVLAFVADVRGVPQEPIVQTLLDEFSLAEAAHRLTREYSEGMLRRLAIASALIGNAPVLVFDESLNGLDPRGARFVRERMEIERDRGAAVLLTGHVLETLERICTRVVLLDQGAVALEVSRAELQDHLAQGRTLEDLYLDATA